ncbi:hypothetical protein FNV43_RR01206 [Rhamnella rubrinervis]|uniref:Uncharacterized protein n=1 Tax=Rhamnella rubrinervis TaxID=2594499 RepID=A0A8K0HS20_9ROSA|nr:hypothetical protein FNV43_RR01206 [Rhamnella rubrinervis]
MRPQEDLRDHRNRKAAVSPDQKPQAHISTSKEEEDPRDVLRAYRTENQKQVRQATGFSMQESLTLDMKEELRSPEHVIAECLTFTMPTIQQDAPKFALHKQHASNTKGGVMIAKDSKAMRDTHLKYNQEIYYVDL